MRRSLSLCLLLVWTGLGDGGEFTLQSARQRLLKGNYAEAEEQYKELAKAVKTEAAALVGLSKAYERQGKYGQALSVIADGLKKYPKSAGLHARHAEVLYVRGQWADAEKAAAKAIHFDEDQFLARWIQGQIYRDRGEIKKADEAFRWFVTTYTKRSFNDMEITDPDTLWLIGLAAAERARWHHLTEQFRFILTEVWGESVKQDKDFWWGRFERGLLYLEKFNKSAAYQEFDKALAINPRAAEVFAAKGRAALDRYEVKDAATFAERALDINPLLTTALRLQADVFMFSGETEKALEALVKADGVNPREETTLARLAACYFFLKKNDQLAEVQNRAEKQNSKPASFYFELADRLEQNKRYFDAEKYYEKALALRPELAYSYNGLGLLYMRMGEEEKARKLLERGFEYDEFNVRVFNTLEVLDHLKEYETVKTKHFVFRFDTKNDKILARFMAKYMEDIYADLAKQFDYKPEKPILIEVFNTHEMFSGRVIALPDLHTIGASTGIIVAMVSPRDKSGVIAKPFNWNRVLRHELVHVFNLEQTKMRCPHWFTEGLAVRYEATGFPPSWHDLLAVKFANKELLNLDNILLGFIRPKSPDQWQLAYLQSLLYVEYMTKEHGEKSIAGMLHAFRDGLDTAGALQKVCKVSKADFEKGYLEFLKTRVRKTAGTKKQKSFTFRELKKRYEANPNDPELLALMAEREMLLRDVDKAKEFAEKALQKDNKQPIAIYVLARLVAGGGQKDKAIQLLQSAVDEKNPEIKVLRYLGRYQLEEKKFEDAAKTYELARKVDPYESSWLIQLARIYIQTGDNAKLIDVLKDVAKADYDDPVSRRKLAELYLASEQYANAERYAWQALEINVLDEETQRILQQALRAQKKDRELEELQKLLE